MSVSSFVCAPLLEPDHLDRDGEESGAEGHLSHSWVIAVAVSLGEFMDFVSESPSPPLTSYTVVIILAVTVTMVIVKMRQRRKGSAASRRRRNYSRTSDELVAAPEQPYEHVWRGPYASRASYNRSPSPVSKWNVIDTLEVGCIFTVAAASLPRRTSLRRTSGLNHNGDSACPGLCMFRRPSPPDRGGM